MDPNIQHKLILFWEDGFVVFDRLIADDVLDEIMRKVWSFNYVSIFKDIHKNEYDPKRFQADVHGKEYAAIEVSYQR